MMHNGVGVLKQIQHSKHVLNTISESHLEIRATFLKQDFYESGPKSKKSLAWRVSKQLADIFIHKIKDPQTKKVYHKLEDMKRSFGNYDNILYTQQSADLSIVSDFLASLDLSSIGTEKSRVMTQEITEEEINKAISRLRIVKMPGADSTLQYSIKPSVKSSYQYDIFFFIMFLQVGRRHFLGGQLWFRLSLNLVRTLQDVVPIGLYQYWILIIDLLLYWQKEWKTLSQI